jgi:hypothetical protein
MTQCFVYKDFKTLEKLNTKFIKVLQHASPIMNSKAHQDESGLSHMLALKWRARFFDEFIF